MTTKRRKFLAILLLAVIGGVITYRLLNQSDEPEYQGRRLSEWLGHWTKPPYQGDAEAVYAIQSIGTNAVPYLVEWIQYEPPRWKIRIRDKLPTWIRKRDMVTSLLGDTSETRADFTYFAFKTLGTNATSALPTLEVMLRDSNMRFVYRAQNACIGIGEPAIPALKAALADLNCPNRSSIFTTIGFMGSRGHSNTCVPILLEALDDKNEGIRRTATNVVDRIAMGLPFP